ncbi:hypothetical protein DNC80_10835 [Flavobacterium sp. SOK18b]|uniref:hypothetical protein n=1 Tax=Flavobacterium sp. SOK18b TaxID=797900 RepID=UPI0015FDB8AA|nr:hypothetical protein [Flavobacterium sp. SOK18b]MBB1194157.1 hypothetical protein [Flavobacterium sp. SOK18b]
MKIKLFNYFFLLFTTLLLAQHHNSASFKSVIRMNKRAFNEIKKKNKEVDSLGFYVEKGDTLIEVSGYELKGVRIAYEEKDSLFLERYKQLVYNKKYQRKVDRLAPTMKIWKDKIKIYFDKSVDKYYKTHLVDFAKYLDKEVDSLKISFVKNKEESNYVIYAIENDTDVNLDPRILSKEGYYLNWNGKQNIYECTLKMNKQQDISNEQILTNTKILFFKTLGYFFQNYDTSNCSSYFSTCKKEKKVFDKKDLEILKYHYSYGICKGTNIDTFEKNHKDAKEALKNGNTKMYFVHEN